MSPAGPAPRVFLVDDHPAVREGLRLLLAQSGIEVCGEAGDAAGALETVRGAAPDLVMVDLSLGEESGLTLLRALGGAAPGVPLLVYSMHEDPFHVQQAFAAGAAGYVTKREVASLLAHAVGEIRAGRRYTSPRAAQALAAAPPAAGRPEALSPRELEVYRLLGEGYSTHAIAEALGVSRRTVESFYARILEKLGVPGMEALRRRAAADRQRK